MSINLVFTLFLFEILYTSITFLILTSKNKNLISQKGKKTFSLLFVAFIFYLLSRETYDAIFFFGLAFAYISMIIAEIDVSCKQIPWSLTILWILQTSLYVYSCNFFNLNYFIVLAIMVGLSLLIAVLTIKMNFGFADCWSSAGVLLAVVSNKLLLPYLLALFLVSLFFLAMNKKYPDDPTYKSIAFIPFYVGLYPLAGLLVYIFNYVISLF